MTKENLKGIRLIAADLDGTLLNNALQLPKSFSFVMDGLKKKGIRFATASGRNWATQKEFFREYLDQISFICDNGAFLVQNQKPFFISELDPSLWMNAADKCLTYGRNCCAVLCGVEGTYVLDYRKNPEVWKWVEYFYTGLTIVPDFRCIRDKIFKVSICHTSGTGGSFYEDFFGQYGHLASVLRTHEYFMDIMNQNISKGSGLAFLQNQWGITPAETVVFGDFENDICLFAQAEHTFLMENAPLSMRKYAKYLAPSNEEEGVTEIIKQYILSNP